MKIIFKGTVTDKVYAMPSFTSNVLRPGRPRSGRMAGALVALAVAAAAMSSRADDGPMASQASSNSCSAGDYFVNWFDRVSAIQAQQPHWVTPLATVTPRLEEELRYDQSWQSVA